MPIDWEAIRAIQQRHAASQLSAFQQNLAQDIVGQGMCTGMCLDWVRRVLDPKRKARSRFGQPGRAAFFNAEEPKKKERSRFEKIRKTHDIYSSLSSRATQDAVLGEAVKVLRSRFKKTQAELGSLDDLAAAFPDDASRDTAMAFLLSLVKNQTFVARATTQNQEIAFIDRYHQFRTAWKEQMKKGLIFKKERDSNFDHLEVVSVRPAFYQRRPVSGDSLWLSYFSKHLDALQAGRAAVVSCGRISGMGHELAFYRPPVGGSLYYLDPNFGEYCFARKSELADFFSSLWDEVYFPREYCRAQIYEMAYIET